MSERRPKILVTNDDGVDGIGLHELARAMVPLGEVTVVAPDREFSGFSSAIGPIWDEHPEIHEARIDGIDTVWSVSGPPALCVMYACLGAFDFRPDLIVSGINPGANVGRAVYYSGTIGATLAGRNYGVPGVAISQAVDGASAEGQAWDDVVASIDWNVSTTIGQHVVQGFITRLNGSYAAGNSPVLNLNVPAAPLDEIDSWSWTDVGYEPRRSLTTINRKPKPGHVGTYEVTFDYGDENILDLATDTGTIGADRVSVCYLSPVSAVDNSTAPTGKAVGAALDKLFG